MAHLIQLCNCSICASSPCIDGCRCTLDVADSGGADGGGTVTNNYDVTNQFTIAKNIAVVFDILSPSSGDFARLRIEANAVEIYNTGCVDTDASATVEVPAGTTTLSVIVVWQCSGTWVENSWDYTVVCA